MCRLLSQLSWNTHYGVAFMQLSRCSLFYYSAASYPPCTFCLASPNQGEAGYWHALTLTLPKHLHTQNTNHGCWCPHKHDTYVTCLSYMAVSLWPCDIVTGLVCLCAICVHVCVGERDRRERWGGGGGAFFGFALSVIAWAHLCCLTLTALVWLHLAGQLGFNCQP